MRYAALLSAAQVVDRVIVIPADRDPVAHCAALGLAGTWVGAGEGASPEAARGKAYHEGGFYLRWRQIAGAGTGPEGAEDGFGEGVKVFHEGRVWVSTTPFNVWEPGTSGWREDSPLAEWRQPTGAHDAYRRGERVSFKGMVWESTVDANVWAPGVFGWREVREGETGP